MPAYREYLTHKRLARWLECAWSVDTPTGIECFRVAPDGCLDIVWERGGELKVAGAMTVEQRFEIVPGAQLVGVRFRPGMCRPFLGVPAAELTDGSTPLETIWPKRAGELNRQLADSRSVHEAVQILLACLAPPANPPDSLQRSIEFLAISNGNANLNGAAWQANLSPRQFRRRCLEECGVSPKLLCRILRFRRTCEMAASAKRLDWPALAADAGYFDQAHLIRDFQSFTGLTPTSVFSKTGKVRIA